MYGTSMPHIPANSGEGQIVLDVREHYISIYLVRGRVSVLLAKWAVLKDAEATVPTLTAEVA
jgi:hypothetical protein